MEIKEITADEFTQKGCSVLPEKEEEKAEDNNVELNRLEKEIIDLKEKQLLEAEEVKKSIDAEFDIIKERKDVTSETTKELFELSNKFRKHLEKNFEIEGENSRYSDELSKFKDKDTQKQYGKIEKYRKRFQEMHSEFRNNIEDFGKSLYTIMTQLYDGVIIDKKMTIRKTGIYPYRCQSRYSPESIMSLLIDNKEEVFSNIKGMEKRKMMQEMYLMMQKLNMQFKGNYYGYTIKQESKTHNLKEPYLVSDVNSGYGYSDISFSYITGFRIEPGNGIRFEGVNKDNVISYRKLKEKEEKGNIEDQKEHNERFENLCDHNLRYNDFTEMNIKMSLYNILEKAYNFEIKNMKQKADNAMKLTNEIKEIGSKFLIVANFNEELMEGLGRL